MDIVDAQLHIGPEPFEETLAEMDRIGVRSVLIDEFWVSRLVRGNLVQNNPGYVLPNGAWRVTYPVAELASTLHPDRFAIMVRLDRRDPGLEQLMPVLAANPSIKAFRFVPVTSVKDAAALADGLYDQAFAVAEALGKPVCLHVPGYVELLPPYLERFPKLQFVIDHCGMGMVGMTKGRPQDEAQRSASPEYVEEIMSVGRNHPNVALKLSHAPFLLNGGEYPFEPVRPFIRRALDAFGQERVIWASDYTAMKLHRWEDLLNSVLHDPEFSDEEKAWMLGKSARALFNWPAG